MGKLQWRDARVDPPSESELCIVRYPVDLVGDVVVEPMYWQNGVWVEWNHQWPSLTCQSHPYYLPMPEEPNNVGATVV